MLVSILQQAQTAYGRGDYKAVRHLARLALEQEPHDLTATFLLGMSYFHHGRPQLTKAYLETCLKAEPDAFAAHAAMATVECQLGNIESGLGHARRCIDLQPEDADAYNHLGLTLAGIGRPHEAIVAFQRAHELNASEGSYLHNLARALKDSQRELQAIEAYQQVSELFPERLEAWLALGQLLTVHSRFEEAVEALQKAVTLDDRSGMAHLLLALALSENKRGDEAEAHLARAIELNPQDGLAYAALGFWQQEKGRFEASRLNLLRAIELAPYHGFAYYNLFRSHKVTEDDRGLLEQIESRLKLPLARPQDQAYMHYALGKAHEDLAEYELAMDHYYVANKWAYSVWIEKNPWDREAYSANFDRLIQTQDPAFFETLKDHSLDDQTPIIVVGMIRSGTSLVEQIISSHPSVVGAGELDFWHRREAEVYGADGVSVDGERLSAVADEYLGYLKELAPNSPRVIDKLPHNYALLGLIHAALPNARIVHLRRNAADNCLSIFTTAYQRPPAFAHDKGNIVFAYREYQRLMKHWRAVLPSDRLLEVDYEHLISDRDSVTREMIAFCGLQWDDACLSHEQNDRAVRTPSLWQVRQPIYKTSVERWRRFEPWLGELRSLADTSSS